MRSRAQKALLIVPFAHYDFVNNFLNFFTTGANNSYE